MMTTMERLHTMSELTGPIRIDISVIALAAIVSFICGIIMWFLISNNKSSTPVNEDFTKAKADEIKDDVIERLRREQGAKALKKHHKELANETMQLLAGIAGGEAGIKDERIRQLELENEALRNENNTLKSALIDVANKTKTIKDILSKRKA